MKSTKRKKPPKRRNAATTRARILAAARQSFAEVGYPQAGIREIAALADVTSPMLLRYFGSKAGLFEAALRDAMPVQDLLGTGRKGLGERLAAVFLDRGVDIEPPSIVVLSTGDADAREVATRVMQDQVIAPLARWLGPPDAHARALEIVMLAMSFVLFTRQLPLISAHPAQEKKVAAWLADSIQQIIDRGTGPNLT